MVEAEETCVTAPPGAWRRALRWGWPRREPPNEKPPFDAVWRAEGPRVRALAARLTGGSPDAAEDMAQEVAVRALQGYASFRGDSDVRTWLYRITLNVVRRHAPAAKSAEAEEGEAAAVAAAVAPRAEQPEERLLRAEGIPAVRRALDALPEELRTPLVLQVYEEKKCREIADLLDLPLGTVLSRLHSARKRLLTQLSEGNSTENAL